MRRLGKLLAVCALCACWSCTWLEGKIADAVENGAARYVEKHAPEYAAAADANKNGKLEWSELLAKLGDGPLSILALVVALLGGKKASGATNQLGQYAVQLEQLASGLDVVHKRIDKKGEQISDLRDSVLKPRAGVVMAPPREAVVLDVGSAGQG